jgi:CHAD domain-containing protein
VNLPTSHREVERKFRVHGLFEMPDLAASGIADWVDSGEPFTMTAVYHDTESLALFRWGITVRRREGGGDEGWHMKLPVAGADGATRDEMHLPLSAGATGEVPAAFVEIVAPLLRGQPLAPVITLNTERTPHLLKSDDRRALVEVVDDVVSAVHRGRVVTAFRELEAEAIDAHDPDCLATLARAVDFLISQGAEPSSASKAAAALGPRTQLPPDVPALPSPAPDDLAVDAIRAVLSQHVRHLLLADVGVRRDLPDSVHQMRVAARRLRSSFATFSSLLQADEAGALREELKWIASELGAIRDTEVMLERLDAHVNLLSSEEDRERARAAIDPMLAARLATARAGALAALRSDRHEQLVDDLITAALDPPVTDAAFTRCDVTLLPLIARTWRRLVRSLDDVDDDGPSEPWHRARITAKRARYAVESVTGIFGRDMDKLADRLADVTEVLGDHQDAHVAQGILREIAREVDGPTGLSLGRLLEVERDVERADRARFRALWPDVRRTARKAGVT